MNPTSSTTKAAGGYGFLGVIAIGTVAVFAPEVYEKAAAVPGFTEAIAVAIATIAAKLQPENVMRKEIVRSIKLDKGG